VAGSVREAELEALNAGLRAENAALIARIEELERRLGQNSQNSSRPPSSDPPSAPKRKRGKRSRRKRGGQPGHRGGKRELVAPERVLGEIAEDRGQGARVRNWLRNPGYVPESLFYVFAGRPDCVFVRSLPDLVDAGAH
jgi:hypothetical protein